jgi:hypothetical protein
MIVSRREPIIWRILIHSRLIGRRESNQAADAETRSIAPGEYAVASRDTCQLYVALHGDIIPEGGTPRQRGDVPCNLLGCRWQIGSAPWGLVQRNLCKQVFLKKQTVQFFHHLIHDLKRLSC